MHKHFSMYVKESISLKLIEEVSILLGIGVFLLWCGLFGFLKYFESLNVSKICLVNNLYHMLCFMLKGLNTIKIWLLSKILSHK